MNGRVVLDGPHGVPLRDLPGPRQLPGLGNAHQLARLERFHLTLEKWADRYGPLFRINLPGKGQIVVVSDRDELGSILRERPHTFRRLRAMREVIEELVGPGVFTAEGDAWRPQRRLAVQALNTDHLHRYYTVVERSVSRLRDQLRAVADGPGVDIHPYFQRFSVDITSALAFGVDFNTLEGIDADVQAHIDRWFEGIARRMNQPIPYWRRFRLPADRALERSMAELHRSVAEFIRLARLRLADDPDHVPDNFLDQMLTSPESFTDEEIVGNTLTMLSAGEDTTAHSLGWAAWYVATRPDVQERMATEALAVLRDSTVPDYGAARQLTYAEAVIREAIRLRSAAPVIFLEAAVDTEISGIAIPAETGVLLMTRHVALEDQHYPNAAEFDPDRWLAPDSTASKHYLAFGTGPRACPGRNLAHLEASAALGMLARCFEITRGPDAPPIREVFGFTVGPSKVQVRLRTRTLMPTERY